MDKLETQIKINRHRLIGHIMRMHTKISPKLPLNGHLLMARETGADQKPLETFQNKCLRQICKIFYPNIISNRDLLDLTKIDKLEIQIKKRRHRLIGHIMRMQNQNIPKVALKWNLLMARETGADQKPLGGEPCWLILGSLG